MTTILADTDESSIALIAGDGSSATYGELARAADALREAGQVLAFLRAENTVPAVAAYVACVEAGLPVLLIDRDIHADDLDRLIATYSPDLLLNLPERDDHAPWGDAPFGVSAARTAPRAAPHPDLALLLSTSGSTGSPKLVRLSRTAVRHNAQSIAKGLGIRSQDRAISSLPYSYTYGLSVINSHLIQGARVVLTESPIVSREFWAAVDEFDVTTIAGVPSSYRMLRQMRWNPQRHASLRYATQAGGRLSDDDRRYFIDLFGAAGKSFFVMYGQTEATARMTIAQPEDLASALSTAGRAVDGGRLDVVDPDEKGHGEIVYRGPNVMMGYAESADDLALDDEMGGTLKTGDLGYVEDGLLFLTGRSKRIVKVFGKRVSLDDVERWLAERLDAVAVQGDDCVVVVAVGADDPAPEVRRDLAEYLGVHPTGVKLARVDELPLLSSGKVDMVRLKESVA